MRLFKTIFKTIIFLGVGYFLIIILFGTAINSGLTNSDSKEIITINTNSERSKRESELKKEILNRFKSTETIHEGTGSIVSILVEGEDLTEIIKDENVDKSINIDPNDIINGKNRYVLYRLSNDKLIDSKMLDYLEKYPNDISGVLTSYDSFNKTDTYLKYISFENEYLRNVQTLSAKDLLSFVIASNRAYVEEKIRNERVYSFISKDLLNNPQFNFVFTGIKNHLGIKNNLGSIAEKLSIDKEYILACIMTEQTRYSITQRGIVKSYLKNVPFLFSYTYGSKGIGGIKDFTATRIESDAINNGYGQVFQNNRGNDLNNSYWEIVYPAYLIKNILYRWEKSGYPINDQPGIIATLYNFGNPENKIPNAEPKIGGSIIQISDNISITFGELGRNFYYYFKIYGF